MLEYISTRAQTARVSSAKAIAAGLADDGGLYVPEIFPPLSMRELQDMVSMDYAARATAVLCKFLEDFSEDEVRRCVEEAYATGRFSHSAIAPLVPLADNSYIVELFHGPTMAFKDMALQLLPRLLPLANAKAGVGEDTLILVATSGDTGKAALDGFAGVAHTKILCFYPRGGVSDAQELQMVTQAGDNVDVVAVNGNFDDAQRGVKQIFGDERFAAQLRARGFVMSSANSINFGRLVPQVAYYVSAYVDLMARGAVLPGQSINVAVPTGNFGNILAAYYAKRMGLPIDKLICASNSNNVLTDFFEQGVYDARRPLRRTMSPSMDILVSSNLERFLFELCGRDGAQVRGWMASLGAAGAYDLDAYKDKVRDVFYAAWVDEKETAETIARVFAQTQYCMDPHTAVGAAVLARYRQESGDARPTILVSTASPFKFCGDVLRALGQSADGDVFHQADTLSRITGAAVPLPLEALRGKPVLHTKVCGKDGMREAVLRFLGA